MDELELNAERIAAEAVRRLAKMDATDCRDCRYLASPASERWCAKLAATLPDADGFCAWGERKGDAE